MSFNDLQDVLDVTEGNLSSHLGRMGDAGAVEVKKEFVDKKPRTTYRLTPEGRELFEKHVETLESLIDSLDT